MEGAFFRLIGIQFQEKRKLKVELHKLLSESLVYGSNPDENWKNNNIARLYAEMQNPHLIF